MLNIRADSETKEMLAYLCRHNVRFQPNLRKIIKVQQDTIMKTRQQRTTDQRIATSKFYKDILNASINILEANSEYVRAACTHTPIGEKIWVKQINYIVVEVTESEITLKVSGKGRMPKITLKY
ncbi:MAG: hypothetical protein HQ522_19660 [Bacteroidetes bacterium]|nr:hypothetical protein [Bacteroidota bacterium]